MDKIRVIKLLIYEGPRDVIENHLKKTLNGTKVEYLCAKDDFGNKIDGEYSITGINIAQFPEILEGPKNLADVTD